MKKIVKMENGKYFKRVEDEWIHIDSELEND